MRCLSETLKPTLYRNEKFTRLPGMNPTRFLRRSPAAWLDQNAGNDNDRTVYRFSHGRTALRAGLEILRLGKGDRVLVPDFICDVAVDPLRDLGVEPIYYAISRDLTPNWEELDSLSDESVKALFMVHCFGQAQDTERFQSFCREHNQLLIEDNCHSFGAIASNGQLLGSFGDISIGSPRKSLPILNGGTLEVGSQRNTNFDSPLNNQPFDTVRNLITSTARNVLSPFPLLLNQFRSLPPYHVQGAFTEDDLPRWAMDEESLRIIESCNVEKLAQDRRRIYSIWEKWLSDCELKPAFEESAPGASPMIFPAWAPSVSIRNQWFEWGFEHRIDVHSWPTLPEDLVTENGNACDLWDHLVCFPIHQEMNPERLEEKLFNLPSIG